MRHQFSRLSRLYVSTTATETAALPNAAQGWGRGEGKRAINEASRTRARGEMALLGRTRTVQEKRSPPQYT